MDDSQRTLRIAKDAGVEVEYAELQSSHGHDGFLAEPQSLALIVCRIGFNDSNSQSALSSHKASLQENF